MSTINLEIVTPEKSVYSADINMLIVRSTDGELGILPKHAPLVAGIVPNAMRAVTGQGEQLIAVAGGFIEVQPTKITILASAAELPINIDINRAQKAYDRAKERMEAFKVGKKRPVNFDMIRAEAALDRAKARLKATRTNYGN